MLFFLLNLPDSEDREQIAVDSVFAELHSFDEVDGPFAPVTQFLIRAGLFLVRRLANDQLAKFVYELGLAALEEPQQRGQIDALSMQELLQVHLLLKPNDRLADSVPVPACLLFLAAEKVDSPVVQIRDALARCKLSPDGLLLLCK